MVGPTWPCEMLEKIRAGGMRPINTSSSKEKNSGVRLMGFGNRVYKISTPAPDPQAGRRTACWPSESLRSPARIARNSKNMPSRILLRRAPSSIPTSISQRHHHEAIGLPKPCHVMFAIAACPAGSPIGANSTTKRPHALLRRQIYIGPTRRFRADLKSGSEIFAPAESCRSAEVQQPRATRATFFGFSRHEIFS